MNEEICSDFYKMPEGPDETKIYDWATLCDVIGESEYPNTAISPESVLDLLPVLEVTNTREFSLLEDLPVELQGQIFVIATPDGKDYLVNTEGSRFCRYVTKIIREV